MSETQRASSGGHGRPKTPPRVGGAVPGGGHMAEFGANPAAFLMRAWRECGELAEFDLQGQPTVLMTGPEASEAFCRAPDEQLSQSEAYEFMTPIFGEGVIFDAPLHKKDQQLAIQTMALRHQNMKSYARVISEEVRRFSDAWGECGEFDVVHDKAFLIFPGRQGPMTGGGRSLGRLSGAAGRPPATGGRHCFVSAKGEPHPRDEDESPFLRPSPARMKRSSSRLGRSAKPLLTVRQSGGEEP